MTFLKIFKKSGSVEDQIRLKGIEISECDLDCGSCDFDYPKSVSIDLSAQLWQSTKEYGMHIVVPTGKSDWVHDPTLESGTVVHAVSKWADKNLSRFPELEAGVKVSVSSLGSDKFVLEDDYASGKKGDLLLLPFFVWINGVDVDNVLLALNTVVPELLELRRNKETLVTVETLKQRLPQVEFSIDENHSYVFLCSHRTRDKRCGVTAPIMKKALDHELRDEGYYRDISDSTPGGVNVTFINHVGGHKYAANVLVYLRTGEVIWLARIRPAHAQAVVKECILGGKTWADETRLVQKFPGIEW